MDMIWTGWSGGGGKGKEQKSRSFGFKVKSQDRNKFFKPDWETVLIELTHKGVYQKFEVKITRSFWNKCSELRSPKIKSFLEENNYIPWKKGEPPKFKAEMVDEGVFRVNPL